jgi:hypothetical protein
MLRPSTSLIRNRYASAYIQPEYRALAGFRSDNVPLTYHTADTDADLANVCDRFRGANPADPDPLRRTRPANFETDLFWSVYVCTGFEEIPERDRDGDTSGRMGSTQSTNHITIVFTETIRDVVAQNPSLSEFVLQARVTVHEIGHQFNIAFGAGVDPADPEHRNTPPNSNIMYVDVSTVPVEKFFFAAEDVAALRLRRQSPG